MSLLLRSKGQGLVETALALPVLLLLLAGAYVCCRSLFLISAAQTAAHAEALRAGRGLAGIEQKMSDSITAERGVVTIRPAGGGKTRLLPSPFPSLAGRTEGIAEIDKRWEEAGGYADLPALQATRIAEASVDCWERKTSSGNRIRGFVRGYVATGFLR
jgi:hypothetical protein